MITTKISQSNFRCVNYSSIKFYVRIWSTDENIRECLLLNSAFIISDVAQSIVLQSVQNLNISRTAWPILMILVSFCRFLNSLSNEITCFGVAVLL